MLTTLYSHWNIPKCFSPQGTIEIFHEPGQQNTSPDVNIRLTF